MAVGNVIFAVFTALVAVNLFLAEGNPLDLGDFGNDQVEGNDNHGPPSKVNDNEKTQEGSNSLLLDFSTRGIALTKLCNVSLGLDHCISCTRAVHCPSAKSGIVTICYDILPYCNKGKCSDIPEKQCKSG